MFRYFHLDFENKFLLIFSLPIIIVVLIESFLVRANANWAAPALISLFVLFFRFISEKKQKLIIINFIANYVIAVFLFASILISSNNKVFDRIRGVDDFVKNILNIVDNKDLVVADRILFSNISYITRDKPNNIYMPYTKGGLVTNHFQMSSPLKKGHQNNFYLIGDLESVSYLLKENNARLINEFDAPFNSSKLKFYEITFK